MKLRLVILATAATVLGQADWAWGQYRMNQSGDLLDANPRVGGTGSNLEGIDPSASERFRMRNQLVTGNVTGGREFRDFIGYSDARDFRDTAGARQSDLFLRSATGVSTSGLLIDNARVQRPFFGEAQTAVAPAGFIRAPGSGGYVPPRSLGLADQRMDFQLGNPELRSGESGRIETRFDTPGAGGRLPADLERPDATAAANRAPGLTPDGRTAGGPGTAGDLRRPEPLDATGLDEMLRFRTATPGELLSGQLVGGPRSVSPYTRVGRQGLASDAAEVERVRRLRADLIRDARGNPLTETQLQELARSDTRLGQTIDARRDGRRQEGRTGGIDLTRDDPLADGERFQLLDPARQSRQYARLLERLERFENDPMADRLGLAEQRRRREAREGAVSPPLPGLPALAELQDMLSREERAEDARPRRAEDPPVRIDSLATGAESPALAEMFEEAEALMREGRFVSAVARYDAAERLVPNQPLTLLGRATAELGGGYFRRAADSLRRAYGGHRELAMARLDLPSLLGEARVEELVADLRERADFDRADDNPLLLLAFLAYHGGDFDQAAAYLDVARRRAGAGGEDFYDLLERYWGLAPDDDGSK